MAIITLSLWIICSESLDENFISAQLFWFFISEISHPKFIFKPWFLNSLAI